MNIETLFKECLSNNIKIMVEDGNLKIKCQKGTLPLSIRDALKMHKEEIIREISLRDNRKYHRNIRDFPVASITQEQLDSWDRSYDFSHLAKATSIQSGMIFHEQLGDDSAPYINQYEFNFTGFINIDAFSKAWKFLLNRHDILRTIFLFSDDGDIHQMVLRDPDLAITVEKYNAQDEFTKNKQVGDYRKRDLESKFNHGRDPLLRLHVFVDDQDKDSNHLCLLTIHHAIIDGWSLSILFQEFNTIYHDFSVGDVPNLAAVRPFSDYIQWLSERDFDSARSYWERRLNNFSTPTSIYSYTPYESNSHFDHIHIEHTHTFSLSESLSTGLTALAKETRTTLSTIFNLGWSLVTNYFSGETDIVFGTTVSGRPQELSGFDSMVGVFINTVPVRVKIDAKENIKDILQSLYNDSVERQSFDFFPLDQIQKMGDYGLQKLFDTIIVFENHTALNGTNNSDDTNEGMGVHESTNYRLSVIVNPGTEISISLQYNGPNHVIVDQENIEHALVHVFNSLVNQKDGSLAEIKPCHDELLLKQKKQCDRFETLALREANKNDNYFPSEARDLCFHQQFENIARMHGDKVIASFHGLTVTYSYLNDLSNRMARYLLSKGLSYKQVVALCVDQPLDLMLCMLAVSKAGGAFIIVPKSTNLTYYSRAFDGMSIDYAIGSEQVEEDITWIDFENSIHNHVIDGFDSEDLHLEISHHSPLYIYYRDLNSSLINVQEVSHFTLMSSLEFAQNDMTLTINDRWLTEFTHDVDSVFMTLWLPILAAGSVEIVSDKMINPSLASALSSTNGIIARQDFWDSNREKIILESKVAKGIVFGEKVAIKTIKDIVSADINIISIYQHPSSPLFQAHSAISSMILDQSEHLPVGRVSINNDICIVGYNGKRLPIGFVGDMYIGSIGRLIYPFQDEYVRFDKTKPNIYDLEFYYNTGIKGRINKSGCIEYLYKTQEPVNTVLEQHTFTPPKPGIETVISDVWKKVLRCDDISRNDDFFSLGGDSLSAISATSMLKRVLNMEIRVKHIFTHRRLSDLAQYLITQTTSDDMPACLNKLKQGDKDNAIFFFPIMGLESTYAKNIANHMQTNMSIYSFSLVGYEDDELIRNTLSSLADFYIQAMLKVQPTGSYKVAGYSGGGAIAYEVARGLLALNKTVDLVGLIDAGRPKQEFIDENTSGTSITYIESAKKYVKLVADNSILNEDFLNKLDHTQNIGDIIQLCISNLVVSKDADIKTIKKYIDVYHASQLALYGYAYEYLEAPITFFSASDSDEFILDPTKGWSTIYQGKDNFELVPLLGNHATIVQNTYVEDLSVKIINCINKRMQSS